jgi:hypothetical protein
MHTRVTRALMAAAAAGATGTMLALTAPGAAQAAPMKHHGLTGPVVVTDHAGYLAGVGAAWRFRWVTATFTVLSCADPAASHGWTGNGVEIGASSTVWEAELGAGCDPGTGAAVDFVTVDNGHVNMPVQLPMTPAAGTSLTVSIYYSRATGFLRFTVTDNSTGDTDIRTHLVGGTANYYGAEVGSQFGGVISAPPADVKTGAFIRCALTTYNVTRGTMLGPWHTSQVIATTTGTAGGALIADAPVLWKGGANFGVWERTTA